MDTIAGSLATLRAAFDTAGIRVGTPGRLEPPGVLIGGGPDVWIGLRAAATGRVALTWRVLLVAGAWDDGAALDQAAELATVVARTLGALPGYQVGDIGRFGMTELGGAVYLAADCAVTTQADIAEV